MELFLVRHGETAENNTGIIQGWSDTILNDKGHSQAQQAAKLLSENIEAIYSSDLQRAAQTAAAFRQQHPGIPYFEDARLRERDFGSATGQPNANYNWDDFWIPGKEPGIAGLETLDDYDARVAAFVQSLKQSGYKKILVVTHNGTINRLFYLFNRNHSHTHYDNGGITNLSI